MTSSDAGAHHPPHIAITGAAGYIGSRVVTAIHDAHPEWTVTALDNFRNAHVERIHETTVEQVDVRNRSSLQAALADADVVIHLAAIADIETCADRQTLAHAVNVRGTANVAHICRETGAALIFPFSLAVLGKAPMTPLTVTNPRQPTHWYGWTKVLGERAIEAFATGGFSTHLFMLSNVYGQHTIHGQPISKGTVLNFFIERARAGDALTVHEPGTQSRNFIHVDDVARAFIRSAEQLLAIPPCSTLQAKYELATDDVMSVRELAGRVADATARATGERPAVELVENPRDSEVVVTDATVDWSRTREEFGWEPTRTVAETIAARCGGDDER